MRLRSIVGIYLILLLIASAMIGCTTKGLNFEEGLEKFETKQLDEALVIFEQIAAEGGDYGNRALFYVGEIKKLQFKWQEAIDSFQTVMDTEPGNSYLGVEARDRVSQITEGRRDIERIKIIHDNNPGTEEAADALLELGSVYQNKLDDYDSAIATYRQIIEEFPGHAKAAQAQIEIGNISFYKKYDYTGGWAEFQKVNLETYPDLKYRISEVEDELRNVNKVLGEIREHQSFIKESQKRKIQKNRRITGYDIYGVRQDQVAQSFIAVGKKWRQLKNYPKAIEAYRMLVARLPMVLGPAAEARYGIAEIYHLEMRRYLEALDAYEEFIKYHPTYFRREEAMYNVAMCYEALRYYDEAYDNFKGYVDTYPEGKVYKAAELKVRQYEYDEDQDGFPYYKELAAGTSDTDPTKHPE